MKTKTTKKSTIMKSEKPISKETCLRMRKLTESRPPCLLEQFVVCEHKRLIQCTFQFSTTEATAKKENKLDSFEHKEIMQWLSVISWHCIHPMYCPLVSNCISRARASCAYLLRCFLNYDL